MPPRPGLEHHRRTGQRSTVRVEALGSAWMPHFEALAPPTGGLRAASCASGVTPDRSIAQCLAHDTARPAGGAELWLRL
jgi:hypothetical protein